MKPKALLLLAGAVVITACGGGGGGGGGGTTPTRNQPTTPTPPTTPATPTNQQPTADAGNPVTVEFGATVTLGGSGSGSVGGSIVSYSWEQVSPESPTISLTGANRSRATFTAPAVTQDTEFEFRLTVTDNDDDSLTATATVTITVSNAPPVANPGTDQSAKPNAEITLDGTGSSDPGGGTIASYKWTQVEPGETTLELTDADKASATFTAPDVEGSTDFKFRLEVTDERGLTHTREVTVTVSNTLPTADVVEVGTVRSSTMATLDGSSSRAFQDRTITYQWTQVATEDAPTVEITDADKAMASFTVPAVDRDVTLTFRLTVTDSEGETHFTEVSIEVSNTAPVATASTEQDTVNPNVSVTLNGTDSNAADGKTIRTYEWTQVSPKTPTINIANDDKDTATFIAPVVGVATTFEFQLEVTDSEGLTSTATVSVTVSNTAPMAVATSRTLVVLPAAVVTLDGSDSNDPGGTIATYQWTQQSPNTPTPTLTNANTAMATFTAPTVPMNTNFVFQLTVTDRNVPPAMHAATVTIKVHLAPTAEATAPSGTTANAGATVRLAGSGSDPGNDGETLTYSWRQTMGPMAPLSGMDSDLNRNFVAPRKLEETTYEFELMVRDEDGVSATDTVLVTVAPVDLSEMRSVAVSGDGRRAVTGDIDGNMRLWDVDDGTELHTLEGHHGPVYAVAMNRDGSLAISGGHDGTVRLWNTDEDDNTAGANGVYGDEIMFGSSPNVRSLRTGGIWVYAVALNPDGTRAASGGFDGKVRLWNTDATDNDGTNDDGVFGDEITFSGESLGSHSEEFPEHHGGTPGTTPTDMSDDVSVTTYSSVYAVALNNAGTRVLSGGADGTVRVWNAANGMPLIDGGLTDDGGDIMGPIYGVDLSGDGEMAVAGGADDKVRVWNIGTAGTMNSKVHEFTTHMADVSSVSLNAAKTRVISAGGDGFVRFWDLGDTVIYAQDDERELFDRRRHTGYVWSVSLSDDHGMALSVGDDSQDVEGGVDGRKGTAIIWETGRPPTDIPATMFSATQPNVEPEIDPDDDSNTDNNISRVDDVVREELFRDTTATQPGGGDNAHESDITDVALSGNGLYVLSTGRGSTPKTRLWDVSTGAPMLMGDVFSPAAALNADGRVAMIGGPELGGISVWDWSTDMTRREKIIDGVTRSSTADHPEVALTPDGRFGVSGNFSGEFSLWNVAARGHSFHEVVRANDEVGGVAISANGRFGLTGMYVVGAGAVQFWTIETSFTEKNFGSNPNTPLYQHANRVGGVALSADGHRALSGSADMTVRFFDTQSDTQSGALLQTMDNQSVVNDVALSADGRLAISAGGSGSSDADSYGALRLWDTTEGTLLRAMISDVKEISSASLNADGRIAASGDYDGRLFLWHLGGSRTIRPPFVTTANAGPDQPNVAQGSMVTLTGSGNDTSGNDLLAHYWRQVPTTGTTLDAADRVALSADNTATVTFTAPSAAATLTFILTVTDAQGLIATDEVTVTVSL